MLRNTASSSGRVPVGSGTRSLEWWPVSSGRRGVHCVINPTDSKAWFPALSKLSTGRRTLTSDDVVVHIRRRTQGWCKQRKVQNMPLIWCRSYYATNSSHVIDHFLSTLLSLRYMYCTACCWKSCLTPAVLYWKALFGLWDYGALWLCVNRRRIEIVLLTYLLSLFIRRSTCGSYRIVSYRDIFCLISYRMIHIYRFLFWLYRAITTKYK